MKSGKKSITNVSIMSEKSIHQLPTQNPQKKSVVKKKIMREPAINKVLAKRVVVTDTEDRWFLNPQYKIEVFPGVRMIIS